MAAETFADDGMDLEYDDPELQRMREEAAKMQAVRTRNQPIGPDGRVRD